MKRFAVPLAALLLLAGACKPKRETPANLNAANKVAVRMVRLYYESAQMLLAAETRNVALPESSAAAVPVVVRELVKGPVMPTSLRLFPADTVVRGAYLLPGGTAIVDLGGATLTQGWGAGSHQELMAVYSLVQTVTANFPEAKSVRVLVNGAPAETLGGHIWVARSLAPQPKLVDPRSR
ncbi:MAG TPA: GerMN domain-containing protein [Thermoanaerobaculia bacterium]